MTSEQLDAKYSQLTGLRFKVSDLVENAGEDTDAKKATYNHLMWHIKNGLIREVDGIKELVEEVIPALQEAFGQPSTAEVIEETETQTESETETQTEQEPTETQPELNETQTEQESTETQQELNETQTEQESTETQPELNETQTEQEPTDTQPEVDPEDSGKN